MRLRQIEIFYHVFRAGSISGAARDLHVSQPSVSKVLRHTEDQLGYALFHRHKGRLTPTREAEELYREAEDLYGRLSTFNQSLENIRGRKGGHLRLAVLPSLSLSVGPNLVAMLRESEREMSVELTTLHSHEFAPALLEKRFDLCIGFSDVVDERIANAQVGSGSLALVSGKALGQVGEKPDLSILDGQDYISTSETGPVGEIVTSSLAERQISPREVVRAHTYHVAVSLARKEIGLAITDQFSAYSQLGSGLHRYLLDELPMFPLVASALADHPYRDLIDTTISKLAQIVNDINFGIARMQPPKP